MEEDGGGHRRLSLFDQMSAVDPSRGRDLAGLTLEDIIGSQKPPTKTVTPTPPAQASRTLLDIIRDEDPNGGSLFGHKDKKSWKAFRDKLRLKRTGAAWTSSIPIPASDVPPIQNYNNVNSNSNNFNQSKPLMSRRGSVRFTTVSSVDAGDSSHDDDSVNQPVVSSSRPQMTRRASSRYGLPNNAPSASSGSDNSSMNTNAVGDEPPARSFRPQMSRRTSSRYTGNPATENDEEPIPECGRKQLSVALAEERSLSAREAVAAQEAAEAEAAAQATAEEQQSPEEAHSTATGGAEGEPVRMSLMDLLEETDRQMGVVGSRYTVADAVECGDEEEEEDDGMDGGDGIEHTCCVCMVRHKGAAFIPCGHTFCRLCSRELWVQRGNCPLCNGYILEILDIF